MNNSVTWPPDPSEADRARARLAVLEEEAKAQLQQLWAARNAAAQAEQERDEALGMLADAHAKMLIPICVHCGAKPGADAKDKHWRECPAHPAHAAVSAAESALEMLLAESREHSERAPGQLAAEAALRAAGRIP